jgi:DNA-binding response OmpR family regulator
MSLSEGGPTPEVIEHQGVRIDLARYRVHVDGREVRLTITQFRLLELFVRHPGRAFSREQLGNVIWGDRPTRTLRNVDQHIKLLRQRLNGRDLIETRGGVGYGWRQASEDPAGGPRESGS